MVRSKQRRCAVLCLGLVVTLFVVLAAWPVRADGYPVPPYGYSGDIEMPGQKAIIAYDALKGREELILSVQLLGESPDAAWVVPLPSPPQVKVASAEWFVQLSDLTQPRIETRFVPFPMLGAAGPGAAPTGVEVLSREQIGAYDVSVLSSDDPGALLEWLNGNGYEFPEEGKPILDAHIREGWFFVATRVLPGAEAQLEGDVQPLWLSFDAERPVYPMRLTSLIDAPIDVLLYVLADHRMQVDVAGFDVEFAGELSLEAVPSEQDDLSALLTGRPFYVTKLRGWQVWASEIDRDLYFEPAESDEPFRRVVYRTEFNPLAACCPCCRGLSPLGLGAGLVLVGRRRFRQTKRDDRA